MIRLTEIPPAEGVKIELKSAGEWFVDLPWELADRALRNLRNCPCAHIAGRRYTSLAEALYSSFGWQRSPEGHAFWYGVYHNLLEGRPVPTSYTPEEGSLR